MIKNTYPGKLIAFEGLDGCGKTTQISQLAEWIQVEGYGAYLTKRRNSKLIARTIEKAKQDRSLSHITYSLIHAADTADNLKTSIIPALKAGFIVLINKYVFTAFARDIVRGADFSWAKKLYEFTIQPDITFYFKASPDKCFAVLNETGLIDFYDAGMDLAISPILEKNFTIFQNKINQQFELLDKEYAFITINHTTSAPQQQQFIRNHVKKILPK